MTQKEKDKMLKQMLKLAMEKILPERTVVFKGFNENGKQVIFEKIVYKKGGFEIKSRWINSKYKK